MKIDEYRDALDRLGLKQTGEQGAGKFLGAGDRTVRRWASDGPVPEAVGMLLQLMLHLRLKPSTVRRIYDERADNDKPAKRPTRANRS